MDSAPPLFSPERRADPAGRFLLRPGHGVGRERPWPGPEWGSANCTFRGSPGPGLRTARFLKVRGRGDPDPRGASRTRVARDSRRGARGLPAAGNPSPNPGQTAAPASSRVLGASEEGCLARAAEIRPLFPPGTLHRRSEEADGSPQGRPGHRKRGPGSGPGAAWRLRRRRPSRRGKPGAAGDPRPAAALWWTGGATARPRPPSSRERTGNPQPGARPSAVFFQVRAGPGKPCVFV